MKNVPGENAVKEWFHRPGLNCWQRVRCICKREKIASGGLWQRSESGGSHNLDN